MPAVPALIAILEHTPRWVWLLLAVLVATGVAQLRAQRLTLVRLTALPAAFVKLSLLGAVLGFAGTAAVAGWAVGLATATALALALGAPPAARWHAAERRLDVPGSWLPLALMLGVFATKYVVGVLVALTPALRHDTAFAGAAGAAYGAFSGLFLGRALALRALALAGRGQAEAVAA